MKHLRPSNPDGPRAWPAVEAPSRAARVTRPRWAFVGLLVCLSLAIPVLMTTWSALRAPDSTQRVVPVGHVEARIGLDYRLSGKPSAVYPSGEVGTSETAAGAVVPDGPLYSRLLDDLAIKLGFHASVDGAGDLESTYAVDVTVETPGGWSTTVHTVEATPFDTSGSEVFVIDLRDVALQVDRVADLTGVGGDEYVIDVSPRLHLTGTTGGGPVQEHLDAPMEFAVEGNVITANAVEVSEDRALTRTASERASYSLGPLNMGVQGARGLLAGLSLVLVAGIAWFASVLFGGVGLGEPDRIAARYRSQIIDVAEAAAPPGPVVMVSAIEELARIAKVEQTVILHEDLGDGAHRYRVFLGAVTYEYETAPEHGGGASHVVAAHLDDDEA